MTWARGGFLGVDAFFVLSGYLITTLLLAEWQRTGHVDVASFWVRRARRLLPAVLVLLLTVSLTARYLVPVEQRRSLPGDGLAALFYVANWRMVLRGGDYFADTAGPSPLEHTWSLGVEEQFYLVCPVVVVLALARSRRPLRFLFAVAVGGCFASSLALALLYEGAGPGRSYYGTDTRAASLLVGVGLAVALTVLGTARRDRSGNHASRAHRFVVDGMALASVLFLGWAWTHARGTDGWLYHGGILLAGLAVAAVLASLAISPNGMVAWLLTVPGLPALGLVSYGVYLWHWPVFLALNGQRTGLTGTMLWLLRCATTIGIACASYVLVERPLRRARAPRTTNATFVATAAATVAVVAAVVSFAPEFDTTTSRRSDTGSIDAHATGGLEKLLAHHPPAPPKRLRDTDAYLGPRGVPATPLRRWRPGTRLVVDVFGDSLPWSLVRALPARREIDVRDRTILGCGVVLSAPYRYFDHTYPNVYRVCRGWTGKWRTAVSVDRPHLAVIMVGRWETMTRKVRGQWRAVGDPVYDEYLRRRLHHAIDVAGSAGARVVLATLPYNRHGERPDGTLFPEDQPDRVTGWNRLLREVAAQRPGVAVLDLGHRITPKDRYTDTAGGYPMRTDGLHLAPEGVRNWVAPWLYPRLIGLARS